jgi:hypothetical protein
VTLLILLAHLALPALVRPDRPSPAPRPPEGALACGEPARRSPLVHGVRIVGGASRPRGADSTRGAPPCLTNAEARAYVPAPQILLEYSP